MPWYKCATCGKLFNPAKTELCPKCGDAVAPSVLTRMERRETAARLRTEGMYDYDEHCHEDDGWKSNSYGAESHRVAVQAHEADLRASYAAHRPADEPTRPNRPNPNTPNPDNNPTRLSNANPANPGTAPQSFSGNPTRLSNANPARSSRPSQNRQQKKSSSGLGWFVVFWFFFLFLQAISKK
ncbi:MAG: hypothetical protein IIY70_03145 [Oscillospiraceae bacterium]|nr:hypothetical protein [Oscillospiraceae bacterium]